MRRRACLHGYANKFAVCINDALHTIRIIAFASEEGVNVAINNCICTRLLHLEHYAIISATVPGKLRERCEGSLVLSFAILLLLPRQAERLYC